MLIFLISSLSFIFFLKSLSFKPIIPPMKSSEWRFLLSPPWFEDFFSCFLVSLFKNGRLATSFCQVPSKTPLKKMNLGSCDQESVEEEKISLLDLPELVFDCILEKLTPAELCGMAGVCSCLRERCTSDHLWDKHLKHKWGSLIGDAAYKEWQWHVASRTRTSLGDQSKGKGLLGFLGGMSPFAWIEPKHEGRSKPRTLPADSLMSLYLSLENGKFWFPAQVYNRENGHVGFLLSCYDAQVSYDSLTDTFQARYSPHGRRTIEEKITWDRLRPPPVDTPAHVLHFSDCLHDLKPGDHVEIQWRRSREFPYGWWYAVIGHLESCEANENHCQCQHSDTVVLEFNQYSPGSRWRQTAINRKEHREEGNEADGFYGGIRKIYKKEEISTWKRLWPNQVFE